MNVPAGTVSRIGLMAALTAAGAFIRVPLSFVPLTLQTLFVCLAGAWLGARHGACSQLVYLLTGLLGFPVFAQGGGPQYVLQPTFGYLAAFPLAAGAVGYVGRNAESWTRAVLAVTTGVLIVYALGIAGLYANLRFVAGTDVTLAAAAGLGLVPLPKDLVLTIPVAALALRTRQSMVGGSAGSLRLRCR